RQAGHHVQLRRAAAVRGIGPPEGVRQRADLQQRRRAARAAQVGLHDVYGVPAEEAGEIGPRVEVLSGRDRNIQRRGQRRIPVHVVRRNRLLPPVTAQLLERAPAPQRLFRGQRLV